MSKTDLRARPMFHHQRASIEAHLTIVFTALAVAREVLNRTGRSGSARESPRIRRRPWCRDSVSEP
jgi:hypothetical protein